ncbi:MAG TPA: hypothetical protein VGG10_08120 [Rhizomicrobium sp.]
MIDAVGASYVVKVISADTANSLTVDSVWALVQERGHGSLDVGTLNIARGTVALTTTNTIGSIVMADGELKFTSAAALGDGAILLNHGGNAVLSAIDSAEIANAITFRGANTITVGHGQTLTLDGALTFDNQAASLTFTGNGHGSGAAGAIDLGAGSTGSVVKLSTIVISGVTLESSKPDNAFLTDLLAHPFYGVSIINGGILDLTNQDNLAFDALNVTGEILNRGPLEHVTFDADVSGGTIAGDFDIETYEMNFDSGTIALQAGDAIHIVDGAFFQNTHFAGDAPAIDLESGLDSDAVLSLEDTTSDGTGPAVDMGVGGDVLLEIDSTFTGTISNFGGHTGGTDKIELGVSYSEGAPTLTYQPNADGTGGELILQYGTLPAIVLNLRGTYTQSDFTVVNHDTIECSAGQLGTTNWNMAVTGNFATGGNWAHGTPDTNADAVVAATGAAYIVKVSSADVAQTLTVDSADATLLEGGNGSLTLGTLDVAAGTVLLTTANTLNAIVLAGGTLEFSNSAALGDAPIQFYGDGALSPTADVQIANEIEYSQTATFGSANGVTLKLDSGLDDPKQINFIGNDANGKANGSGVVDLDGPLSISNGFTNVLIGGVTLATSIANNITFSVFVSEAQTVDIAQYGVLDLSQQNNVTVHGLSGDGEIVNMGPNETFTIESYIPGTVDVFQGEIKGDFNIKMYDIAFSGTIALSPGDFIAVRDSGNFEHAEFIGAAPTIQLDKRTSDGSLDLTNTTFDGAAPAIGMGVGQNNSLYIDHSFAGSIVNFGGHNGGTDHIFIADEAGLGVPTLQYEANAQNTGGVLVVQYGPAPAFDLNLVGTYTQADFTVDANNSTEIDCSAEQSSPHVPAHLDSLI